MPYGPTPARCRDLGCVPLEEVEQLSDYSVVLDFVVLVAVELG